ncbi:hydrogenase maturation protease [Nonomuraea phyllanthi]|uniref:hydrogenase maturation protease n=1 Tax=Nonomuraea phyllanthi TaxID=2219224 RepID=UPI001D02CB67|nr:hydrogenase maturation protease [Nonomuraea phyllanthi]
MVIGVGNDARGDDAAGLQVARLLRDMLPPRILVAESSGDPMHLVATWSGAQLAIVIEAVSSGAAPGTVHHDVSPRLTHPWQGSSHALGLADAIALAAALDRLPRDLHIYGIEGADFAVEAPVTPAVQAAIRETAQAIGRRLKTIAGGTGIQTNFASFRRHPR